MLVFVIERHKVLFTKLALVILFLAMTFLVHFPLCRGFETLFAKIALVITFCGMDLLMSVLVSTS